MGVHMSPHTEPTSHLYSHPIPLDELERQEWKAGLKFNIQKTKIMTSSPITSWQIEGEKVEAVTHFILGGSKLTIDGDYSYEDACFLEGKLWQTETAY